ncbi:MAG: hypothetical protein LBH62_03545 [Nitrososphaerota archaeon]|jgi:hypothetical protein|nr:hypothetical protein [Nitrososphaerota archaeon]
MEQKKLLSTVGVTLLLIVVLIIIGVIVRGDMFSLERDKMEGQVPFYVGVTYCGNSVGEAKEFIDKVWGYTNLFVLVSGSLQYNTSAMEEIGNYAVASGLSYAVYGGTRNTAELTTWLLEAKERWREKFIGIYYNDEVGGYMLDQTVFLEIAYPAEEGNQVPMPKVTKTDKGTIILYNYNNIDKEEETQKEKPALLSTVTFWPEGKIVMENFSENITYYPNGTVTVFEKQKNDMYTTTSGNITKYSKPIPAYEQIFKQNPIQTHDDAAKAYVNMNRELIEELNKTQLEQEQILVFSADYGLYWWNYQSGYDLVLAELAWNNSITQEIALARGAATLQNKQWGTILTWKYTQAPFLASGEEMFEQMKTSYQAGAQYIIIFNYSEDPADPNTLQEEHFTALEHFWKEIVQNPKITHGSIKAEAVLVLPKNYGWSMRNPTDPTWGIWPADENTQKIWNQIQNKIDQHGLKLDLVFEDINYPVKGKYTQIHYWNQK